MKSIPGIVISVYSLVLRLYPGTFRNQFEEQMFLDFSDMAVDARRKGRISFILFCLRELIDFPFNLLIVYFKDGHMLKVLRSQPVNSGLRGSLGFGVAFAGLTIATWRFRGWLFSMVEPMSQRLPAWYYEVLGDYDGDLLFLYVLLLSSSAFAGLILGVLLALLLGKRSQFFDYVLAGMLGWFIPIAIFTVVLSQPFNSNLSLDNKYSSYLGMTVPVLHGAFLGAMLNLTVNERITTLRRFILGVMVYPTVAYIYLKILSRLDFVTHLWLFVAVMILLAMFLGSVIVTVMIGGRKLPWMVIAGAVGYPVLSHVGMLIARLIHLPMPEPGIGVSEISPFVLQVSAIAQQAIFGILFGLVLGIFFGYQKRNSPPKIIALKW
jgi:hypothetical protein